MIHFFRKIRQKKIVKNHISKYLLYAAGEIVLVVIGILIALQINTWNNDRLERIKETKVLTELKTGFVMDLKLVEEELERINGALAKIKELESMVGDETIQYQDGLDSLFGAAYGTRNIRLTIAFYEDLKASGLGLIKNDDIRLHLVKIFEDNYEFIDRVKTMEYSINEITRPYYLNHFKDIAFWQKATPIDFKSVWNDPYYKNILHYRYISLDSNQKQIYERTIPALEELIREISDYLEKRKNG